MHSAIHRAVMPPLARTRNLIFFASGFAGLIYESIWTHYLKLFLGHAAYAQTLVLAIFMGGMAIGAALAARYSARITAPLRAYAAIEGAIGVAALVFHAVFVASTDGFYDFALARELEGTTLVVLKWSLATVLILPQSVLLGATFPLFAAAATRAEPAAAGRSLATLYFANSLGGALGVLASGFVLVPQIGLPATMASAGAMNLAIAVTVIALSRDEAGAAPIGAVAQQAAVAPLGRIEWFLLAVALLTGASSFVYEVAWIRMLSLVLGSATHSFELMLSAFILGLALGGAWIRRRIDGAAHPGRLLGQIQIVMGFAALATVPLYSACFDLVAFAVREAPKSDGGYALFNIVRYGVSALVMMPAAFCAGMTLPLATRMLFARPAQGERAIGFVYGANTVGAIVGLVFAVHVGLPVFGLEYLVASGAIVDVALGVALLAVFGGAARWRVAAAAVAGSVAATAAVATTFDSRKLASGVYRSGKAATEGRVLGIVHGKTATISIERNVQTVSLRTNGKPDASAMPDSSGAHALDEVTMALTGALPLMLHDSPRRVANIGFGAGLTGAILLTDRRVEAMDTVEIEPSVVALARHFAPLNTQVYDDARSQVHYDDAKSFFAVRGKTYDLIISEPSNPWVSGVAGLFSVEFYRHVARYLANGGLFAQWLQIYETHPERVVSVLKAVDQSFTDWLVVAVDQSDLLIVAAPRGSVALHADAFGRLSPETHARLRRLAVATPVDTIHRVIGDRRLLKPWLDRQQVPANSDFDPYLDAHADRDRFVGGGFNDLVSLAFSPYPMAEVLGARPPVPDAALPSINQHFGAQPPALAARLVAELLLGPQPDPAALPLPAGLPPELAAQGRRLIAECHAPPLNDRAFAAASLAIRVLPYLSAAQGVRVLDALAGAPCLDEAAGAWPRLLRAVAARDAATFGVLAEQMLGGGEGATEVRARYLIGLALLGHLAGGDAARARAVWGRFATAALHGKPPSLALDVLRASAFDEHERASR